MTKSRTEKGFILRRLGPALACWPSATSDAPEGGRVGAATNGGAIDGKSQVETRMHFSLPSVALSSGRVIIIYPPESWATC